ncbi:MAG TPA: alpha/beta hydrolase [Stellaceae bacterium]|nr:alpha/beta hydrolase [Stellaceae bacterium]
MSLQNFMLTLTLRRRVKRFADRPVNVPAARALAQKTAMKMPLPPSWRIRPATTPFQGEWIERQTGGDRENRTILYFHGGGYFFCSPETHRAITVNLATRAEARVFAPDYRLAPEHRFPAAVEDALASYRGIVAAGTPEERVVVGGDSAGGGLALALLLALREAKESLPAGAVLFSPWTDLAATGDSLRRNDRSDAMFRGHRIAGNARLYLGDTPPTHPLASPLYADLKGLPPLFIQASDSEVLLDDSIRLAEKATKAGVAVDFRAWHRLPHVWHYFAPMLPEGRAALAEAAAFIRRVVP